jgi:hypothetical protein
MLSPMFCQRASFGGGWTGPLSPVFLTYSCELVGGLEVPPLRDKIDGPIGNLLASTLGNISRCPVSTHTHTFIK